MKRKIIIFMIMILFSCTIVGCNSKSNLKEHEDKDVEINNENEDNIESSIIYKKYINGFLTYKSYIIDSNKTYSVLKAYDELDNLIWTYKTNTVDKSENPYYDFVGAYDKYVFIKNNTDIIVLSLIDGKEINKINNFSSGITFLGLQDNELYFAKTPNKNYIESQIISYDSKTLEQRKIITLPEKYTKRSFEYEINEDVICLIFKFNDDETDGSITSITHPLDESLSKWGFIIEEK